MASSDAGALSLPLGGVDRGIGRWGRDYVSMVHWHLASLRIWLLTITVVQALSGVGFVLGISLFFRQIPVSAALYVVTGVPVINLLIVGLVLGPQLVAQQRTAGSYEYMRTLPISRSVSAAAWYTVCLLCGLPAVVVSLAVGQLRYGLPLQISPMIIPAVLLTAFAGTMLGYALAHAISAPTAEPQVQERVSTSTWGATRTAARKTSESSMSGPAIGSSWPATGSPESSPIRRSPMSSPRSTTRNGPP